MTYDLDWKNPDYWQHDGTLSYDEGNNVIFFDISKEKTDIEEEEKEGFSDIPVINIENCDAWCKTVIDIPDDVDSYNLSFTVVNGSVTGKDDSGCVSAEFIDANGKIIDTVCTVPIRERKYFYEYKTQGLKEDSFVNIPENAEKMQICIYGEAEGKVLDFYVKNMTLELDTKPYNDTPIVGINGVFVHHKLDDKPVIIGTETAFANAYKWVVLGILVAATVTVIAIVEKHRKSKQKNSENKTSEE